MSQVKVIYTTNTGQHIITCKSIEEAESVKRNLLALGDHVQRVWIKEK